MANNAALDPQTAEYLETFKTLTDEEQHLVNQSLEKVVQSEVHSPEGDLADSIAGRRFTRQERIQLEMDTLARHFQRRRQLLEGSLTAPQVAEMLGTSRQTPHDRVSSQTLLAIKDNGKLRFPLWQFDPEGPDGVIDGLPQILKSLQMSDYAKHNWLSRPNPYLEGQAPIELLKQGEIERVHQVADDAGASQWS